MKEYCIQNNGDCTTCSLVNYNRDCQNNPIWGGKRQGAGRPDLGRKRRQYYLTDKEHEEVKKFIDSLRV